jgi:hypothetical protein
MHPPLRVFSFPSSAREVRMSRSIVRLRTAKRAGLATALACILVAVPAASQQAKGPKTQLWLDVATHSMAGMPDMSSGMGGAAMRMFGGDAMQNHYGSARYAGMPGRYVDIAMLNQLNPGKEAEDLIPAGMQLGKSLPLLPPKAETPAEPGGTPRTGMADGNAKARILIYWGCSPTVRPGQPKEIKFEVKNGKVTGNTAAWGNAMQGRYVPDRSAKVDPRYALWPNEKLPQDGAQDRFAGRQPPHRRRQGAGVPAVRPDPAAGFHARDRTGQHGRSRQRADLQLETGRSRAGLLPACDGHAGRRDGVLEQFRHRGRGHGHLRLPAAVHRGQVDPREGVAGAQRHFVRGPQGHLRGPGRRRRMLQMIAFGPESNIAWPPKPTDPKVAWNPEWNVRVRNKSTATAMLGMSLDATQAEQRDEQQPQENKAKRLLKGLLGR